MLINSNDVTQSHSPFYTVGANRRSAPRILSLLLALPSDYPSGSHSLLPATDGPSKVMPSVFGSFAPSRIQSAAFPNSAPERVRPSWEGSTPPPIPPQAGTGCGGCVPLLGELIACVRAEMGMEARVWLCEHFPFPRHPWALLGASGTPSSRAHIRRFEWSAPPGSQPAILSSFYDPTHPPQSPGKAFIV